MTKKERFDFVIDWFKKNNLDAETELHYTSVGESSWAEAGIAAQHSKRHRSLA